MTPVAADLQAGRDLSVRNNLRRSLRIPLSVPLVISDPRPHGFSECCETIAANSHGCQLRSYRPLATGMQVRLDAIYTSRTARATVVHSEPVGRERDTTVWNCGLALDKPGNFWGIPSPPRDWPSSNGSEEKDVVSPASPPESLPDQKRRMAVRESLPGGLDRSSRDLQQIVSVIDAHIAGFEARLEQVSANFETGALTRLQQSFGEAIRQGQERMKHFANACGESRLVNLEAELERRLEPFLTRSQAAINDLERLLNVLRQEQAAWEAQRAQQHQQFEDHFRGWLAEETQRFRALIHDAVVEAGGQVKGRIVAIVETACDPLERRARDAQAHLEALALRKTDELSRRCEVNLERLYTVQEEMDRSFRARLAAQQAEALDLFPQQAKDAIVQAIARMHAMLNGALESTARALQDQPAVPTTQLPGQDSAGGGQVTDS